MDKDQYLAVLKEKWKSSPSGKEWHKFWIFLKSHSKSDEPPKPLILAASAESHQSKFEQLSKQLDWTVENGCYERAIRYLDRLSDDKWNIGSPENWNKSFYYE